MPLPVIRLNFRKWNVGEKWTDAQFSALLASVGSVVLQFLPLISQLPKINWFSVAVARQSVPTKSAKSAWNRQFVARQCDWKYQIFFLSAEESFDYVSVLNAISDALKTNYRHWTLAWLNKKELKQRMKTTRKETIWGITLEKAAKVCII